MRPIAVRRKIGEASKQRWQTPEFRAKLIEKQKRLGLRNYPTKNEV
jgi:hypothetical protein